MALFNWETLARISFSLALVVTTAGVGSSTPFATALVETQVAERASDGLNIETSTRDNEPLSIDGCRDSDLAYKLFLPIIVGAGAGHSGTPGPTKTPVPKCTATPTATAGHLKER